MLLNLPIHSRRVSLALAPATLALVLASGLMPSPAAAQVVDEPAEATTPAEPQSQALTTTPPARASMSDPVTVSYNLGMATDYSTRGVSQTGGKPVLQGGLEVAGGYFYAGTWASNVDFGDGTEAEIDVYAGVRGESRGIDWDLRALGYAYVGQPDGSEYNYVEFRASAAKQFGPATLGAVVFYAPDYFGTTSDESLFLQATGAYEINPRLSLSAGLGRQWIPGPGDHTTWHFGPTYKATERVSVDLRYYDTDRHELGSNYDSRVVLGVKTLF